MGTTTFNYEIYKGKSYPIRLLNFNGFTAKIACEELYDALSVSVPDRKSHANDERESNDRWEAELVDMGILCYMPTSMVKYFSDAELTHIIQSQRIAV